MKQWHTYYFTHHNDSCWDHVWDMAMAVRAKLYCWGMCTHKITYQMDVYDRIISGIVLYIIYQRPMNDKNEMTRLLVVQSLIEMLFSLYFFKCWMNNEGLKREEKSYFNFKRKDREILCMVYYNVDERG